MLLWGKIQIKIFPIELVPCVPTFVRLYSFALLVVLEQLQDGAEVDARLLIVVVLRSDELQWAWD